MKRLKFKYQLSAFYNKPITDHRFFFRFLPKDNERQKIENTDIFIANCHKYDKITDFFGNEIIKGYINQQHARFDLEMSGSVITGIDIFEEFNKESVDYYYYRQQTGITEPGEKILQLYRTLNMSSLKTDYEKAVFLTCALYEKLKYDQTLTSVGDSAEKALSAGGGVCQDYAHIMLSLLRHDGLTARYTAGMLLGEGGSHAWVEVLCNKYWYGFDPTNCKLVNDEYIKVSCGRDSSDCPVISGTMNGSASQKQIEHVIVKTGG